MANGYHGLSDSPYARFNTMVHGEADVKTSLRSLTERGPYNMYKQMVFVYGFNNMENIDCKFINAD